MNVVFLVMCFSVQFNEFISAAGTFKTQEEAEQYISYDSRECYIEQIREI
jgi:hypothetical protein